MADPPPSTLDSETTYLERRIRFRGTKLDTFCDLADLLKPRWDWHLGRWCLGRKVFEFHIWGLCPSCNGPTEGLFSLYTATGLSAGDIEEPPKESSIEGHAPDDTHRDGKRQALGVQHCACVENHPDPASSAGAAAVPPSSTPPSTSTFGCGASWLVGIRYNTKKPHDIEFFTPIGQLEAEYWQSAEATSENAPNALSNIQTAAKGWSTALAAIIALVSLSGIIGGRDTLAKLSTTSQWTLIGLAGFALVTAAVALYLSALANLGMPSLKRVSSPSRSRSNDLGPLHEAAHAATSLRLATVFTAFAFLAALIALGIFVKAPDAPAAAENNEVSISGLSSPQCGSVSDYSTDPKLIAFTPKGADSPSHIVRAARLRDIGASC
jgi:hypothetical protein